MNKYIDTAWYRDRIMRIFAAPKLEPGRIMVIEGDVVVMDGRLADLIPDDGQEGDFDVYLNPVDVEPFKERWCAGHAVVEEIRPRRRVHADPDMFPGRVRVVQGTVQIAMGSISNLACISRALSTDGVDVYVNPHDAQDLQAWLVEQQAAMRRLN